MAKTYHSKIDAGLLILLLLSALSALGAGLIVIAVEPGLWPVAIAVEILGVWLPLWILFGTRYTLDAGGLNVRCGPFKWHVPVVEITDISPTSNMVSSPALSLDRLRISYGKGRSVMISPRDKTRFLSDLQTMRGSALT